MLKNDDLYRAIFRRKSVRKFEPSALLAPQMEVIAELLTTIVPLTPETRTMVKIVAPDDVRGLIQVKAPHYVAAFSEEKPDYLLNAGYLLQQLDLSLSSVGLGCCWQGWPKPTRDLGAGAGLSFVIALALGTAREPLHRSSASAFKRKPLADISDGRIADAFLEPVRLAPSSSQPWFFSGDEDTINAYCVTRRGLRSKLFGRIDEIDMGVAFCHLSVAAQHFGKSATFVRLPDMPDHAPAGHHYVGSFLLGRS